MRKGEITIFSIGISSVVLQNAPLCGSGVSFLTPKMAQLPFQVTDSFSHV